MRSSFVTAGQIHSETLAHCLLAISALFPQSFSWVATERDEKIEDLLERLGPDACVAWGVLQGNSEISLCGKAALDLCPSSAEIKTAPLPAAAWLPVVEKIEEGRRIAEATLELAMPAPDFY